MAHLAIALQRSHGSLPTQPSHPAQLSTRPLVVDARAHAFPGQPPVDPLLWSGFIEHIGRCIYGGVVDDYRDPSPSHLLTPQAGGRLGWRKDVMEVLGRDELATPMIRWPGGNFVSNYHWWDAIGPIEERKKIPELAWSDVEPNL